MTSADQRPLPEAADLYGDLLDTAAHPKHTVRDHIPGLLLTTIAALAASWLAEHYGAPPMLMGLLIGLALNFTNTDKKLHPGLAFASSTLLRWGIVLAGLQVTIWQIADLGWQSFVWLAGMIAIVTAVGALVARWTGLGASFGTLAGGAVAICGASAALAVSSLLGEKRSSQAQLTLVLVTVSAASALAMSLYPAIAHLIGLTGKQAGWLVGSSIHDVAQAMGAGYSFSDEAGQTATIVKLTRVAMLAPALAVIALIFPAQGDTPRSRIGLPWFVVGFLLLGLARSFLPMPEVASIASKQVTSALLLLAVTATGIRSPMHLLLGQGWRPAVPVVAATIAAFALGLAGAMLLG
jgi:uncharacterized integral membrane protein (TIGR00698 family)